MREKARKSRTFKKDEEGHSGSVWHHRIPVIDSKQKKVTLFSKKDHLHHKSAAEFYKYPWRHSLQSGTSAFHGSCRTSTAKLRSRVCRGGESCMRSFFSCCVFKRLYFIHALAASNLSSRRRQIGSTVSPLCSPFL